MEVDADADDDTIVVDVVDDLGDRMGGGGGGGPDDPGWFGGDDDGPDLTLLYGLAVGAYMMAGGALVVAVYASYKAAQARGAV